MSFTNISKHELIRQAKLLYYANTKRNDGDFNDVTIQAGAEKISANRMVLACYSGFFELMFRSQLKEKYQNTVEIKEFDGQAVKLVIEYIYTGKIDINANNIMTLLGVADFLQVDDVRKKCFDFLENSLTVDNCLDAVKAFVIYSNRLPQKQTYKFIRENFDEIVQRDNFTDLSKLDLTYLITNIDRNSAQETLLYTAIIDWVKHDQTREAEFSTLFLQLNLQKLSSDFVLNTIAKEQLVKNNNACLNAMLSYFTTTAKQTQKQFKSSEILCLGGYKKSTVVAIHNRLGKLQSNYPNLPSDLMYHRALELNDFIYCVGGSSDGYHENAINNFYRLSLKTAKSHWEEGASMKEQRLDFGAAVWNGNLVVTGGYNNSSSFNTTELFELRLNKWRTIASMNESRTGHELVVADDKLFAIGGSNAPFHTLSSVERLDNVDDSWTFIKPMNMKRCYFAAVTCNNFIYAIGGWSNEKTHKTVEKFDLNKNEWSFVQNMNVERRVHAACIFNEKIFVVGGLNEKHKGIKQIECYESTSNNWSIVGETEQEFRGHAVVAV